MCVFFFNAAAAARAVQLAAHVRVCMCLMACKNDYDQMQDITAASSKKTIQN